MELAEIKSRFQTVQSLSEANDLYKTLFRDLGAFDGRHYHDEIVQPLGEALRQTIAERFLADVAQKRVDPEAQAEKLAARVAARVERRAAREKDLHDAVEKRRVATATRRPTDSVSPAGIIRQWARENGIEVGERGRLNPELVKRYNDRQQ